MRNVRVAIMAATMTALAVASAAPAAGSEFLECHTECQTVWERCFKVCHAPDTQLTDKTCRHLCTIIYEECIAQCLPTLRGSD